jgi:hypothetical protein
VAVLQRLYPVLEDSVVDRQRPDNLELSKRGQAQIARDELNLPAGGIFMRRHGYRSFIQTGLVEISRRGLAPLLSRDGAFTQPAQSGRSGCVRAFRRSFLRLLHLAVRPFLPFCHVDSPMMRGSRSLRLGRPLRRNAHAAAAITK